MSLFKVSGPCLQFLIGSRNLYLLCKNNHYQFLRFCQSGIGVRAIRMTARIAVSYTHLDVYKRQGLSYGAHPLTAGSRICFWAGRILFAGRTRTGRRHSKMGFYVIVPRKARHDSTGNPISSFKPAIAPLDCEFVFGGGRFLLTGRTWTGSVGWQTSEPMCSFLVCLTKPLATIYNFKCIS